MQVRISPADGADNSDMGEFYGWLRETRTVTRGAEVKLATERGAGTMSAGDIITLTTGVVSALSAVVSAYAAWRASRPAAPPLKLTIGSDVVVLTTGSAEETARVLQAAERHAAAQE